MKETLEETKAFLGFMSLWLAVGAVVMFLTDQKELHLWFNSWHNPVGDVFFKYATYMAEGVFAGAMVILIFIYKIRYGVASILSFAGAGLLAQLFKRGLFSDVHRPSKVFETIADLHFVPGVKLHSNFSFPSGHSTEAFSIFFMLGFLSNNRLVQIFCFFMALTVASSRVYLSQHFFEDIYAGSLLGTVYTFIIIALFNKRAWGEQGILDVFTKNKAADSSL